MLITSICCPQAFDFDGQCFMSERIESHVISLIWQKKKAHTHIHLLTQRVCTSVQRKSSDLGVLFAFISIFRFFTSSLMYITRLFIKFSKKNFRFSCRQSDKNHILVCECLHTRTNINHIVHKGV